MPFTIEQFKQNLKGDQYTSAANARRAAGRVGFSESDRASAEKAILSKFGESAVKAAPARKAGKAPKKVAKKSAKKAAPKERKAASKKAASKGSKKSSKKGPQLEAASESRAAKADPRLNDISALESIINSGIQAIQAGRDLKIVDPSEMIQEATKTVRLGLAAFRAVVLGEGEPESPAVEVPKKSPTVKKATPKAKPSVTNGTSVDSSKQAKLFEESAPA